MPKKESGFSIVWRAVYPVLIFYGAELLVELGGTIAYILSLQSQGVTPAEAAEWAGGLSTYINSIAIYLTVIRCLILIPIFILLYRSDLKREFYSGQAVCYKDYPKAWLALLPVVGFMAALGFNQLIELIQLERLSSAYQAVKNAVYGGPQWLTILSSVILAPLAEEFLFRGLVYKRLRTVLKPIWPALVSSALFGLVHGNLVQFVYAFLVGMLLCFIYEKFKTIWAPIIAHAGANLISILFTWLLPNFETMVGPVWYTVLMVVELAVTFLLLWILNRKVKRDS